MVSTLKGANKARWAESRTAYEIDFWQVKNCSYWKNFVYTLLLSLQPHVQQCSTISFLSGDKSFWGLIYLLTSGVCGIRQQNLSLVNLIISLRDCEKSSLCLRKDCLWTTTLWSPRKPRGKKEVCMQERNAAVVRNLPIHWRRKERGTGEFQCLCLLLVLTLTWKHPDIVRNLWPNVSYSKEMFSKCEFWETLGLH